MPPLSTIPSDPQAFAQAHSALAAWIRRRLIELTGNDHTADDLSQRTWQAVWEAVSQGRYDSSRAAMSTFVYAISQNVYRNWARSRATVAQHAPAIAANAQQGPETGDDPLADAEVIEELRRVLRDGASGLSPQHLQALHLIARGATDREMAVELAVAPSTAHARKREAIDALRAHLDSRFFSERTPPGR